MSVTVGYITFDRASYDRDADVLYLSVRDPSAAVAFDESPEGHALRYDGEGNLVGITIANVPGCLNAMVPSSSRRRSSEWSETISPTSWRLPSLDRPSGSRLGGPSARTRDRAYRGAA